MDRNHFLLIGSRNDVLPLQLQGVLTADSLAICRRVKRIKIVILEQYAALVLVKANLCQAWEVKAGKPRIHPLPFFGLSAWISPKLHLQSVRETKCCWYTESSVIPSLLNFKRGRQTTPPAHTYKRNYALRISLFPPWPTRSTPPYNNLTSAFILQIILPGQ